MEFSFQRQTALIMDKWGVLNKLLFTKTTSTLLNYERLKSRQAIWRDGAVLRRTPQVCTHVLHEWNNESCLYEIKGAWICSSPRGFLRTRVASGNEEEVVYCKPFGGEYWIGRTWWGGISANPLGRTAMTVSARPFSLFSPCMWVKQPRHFVCLSGLQREPTTRVQRLPEIIWITVAFNFLIEYNWCRFHYPSLCHCYCIISLFI